MTFRTKANMKTAFLIILTALVASCGTPRLTTQVESPTIVLSDTNLCVSAGLSASINQDSLFMIFDEGFILQSGTNSVKIYWQSLGTADVWNGNITIEPNVCLNNTDFCVTGQYWVQVHQSAFMATIQRGITFGTPATSIFVQYVGGKLSVRPNICIRTRVTARSLK